MLVLAIVFPRDFLFGFSESGFQFEMGFKGSEDPNSDWWVWVRDFENVISGVVSGDLPEDGVGYWDLYSADHELAARLGMNCARIGVEWSRIFPRPTYDVRVDVERDEGGNITSIGVDYRALEELDRVASREAVGRYRSILGDWRSRGGIVIVNLNHFTLPLWLHDPVAVRRQGPGRAPSGWLSSSAVVEFAKYASYIAWKFDDLADYYSTLNEPTIIYIAGYLNVKSGFPPGYISFDAAREAAKNLAEAHARAYEAIKRISKKPVGLINATTAVEPISPDHAELAEIASSIINYPILDAVTTGKSMIIGERRDLAGKLDWIGVNYYSRTVIKPDTPPLGFKLVEGYGFNCGGVTSLAGRRCSDFGWEVYPEGLYKVLLEVWRRYGLEIIVTENGVADKEDIIRPGFIASHMAMTAKALEEGVKVKGYLHWALTDNYEWAQGFRMRFGLAKVDYESKKRKLRPSSLIFKEIAENRGIPGELEYV
ncbi:MAG: beta-galactosidase BgaS [Thermoprotei archaeon]|nr:beta-galactosidase BgaS [Thermoprotei archaeon]